jgi:hypothetical protein
VCVPWLLLVALALRLFRAGVSDRARSLAIRLVPLAALPFVAGIVIVVFTDRAKPWAMSALFEIPLRILAGSPAATAATWGLCVLGLAGAYALVQAQAARMEVPTRPVCTSWIRFGSAEG